MSVFLNVDDIVIIIDSCRKFQPVQMNLVEFHILLLEPGVICMPESVPRFLTWSEWRDIWGIIKIKVDVQTTGSKVDIQWLVLDVGFQNDAQNLG